MNERGKHILLGRHISKVWQRTYASRPWRQLHFQAYGFLPCTSSFHQLQWRQQKPQFHHKTWTNTPKIWIACKYLLCHNWEGNTCFETWAAMGVPGIFSSCSNVYSIFCFCSNLPNASQLWSSCLPCSKLMSVSRQWKSTSLSCGWINSDTAWTMCESNFNVPVRPAPPTN